MPADAQDDEDERAVAPRPSALWVTGPTGRYAASVAFAAFVTAWVVLASVHLAVDAADALVVLPLVVLPPAYLRLGLLERAPGVQAIVCLLVLPAVTIPLETVLVDLLVRAGLWDVGLTGTELVMLGETYLSIGLSWALALLWRHLRELATPTEI